MKKIITCLLIVLFFPIFFCGCSSNQNAPKPNQGPQVSCIQMLNGIDWTVTYYSSSKSIISIQANYSENERSSEFYKNLAYREGDSTVWITHKYVLYGTPLEDHWFRIEKTEIIVNGWHNDEIFEETTIRFEQKLVFSI